jgi:hypothetical protein
MGFLSDSFKRHEHFSTMLCSPAIVTCPSVCFYLDTCMSSQLFAVNLAYQLYPAMSKAGQ